LATRISTYKGSKHEYIKKKILVICTANVCRSPAAEAVIRQKLAQSSLLEAVEVLSAGIYAASGDNRDPFLLDMLNRKGIDCVEQNSCHLTREQVSEATLILVMEEQHRWILFNRSPTELHKVFLLSELSGRHEDVLDAYGRGREAYEAMLDHLQQLIDSGWSTLCQRLVY
jgi:protein-tyrosine phosphatase